MAEILKLKENNLLKVEIHNSDDTPTGEYLVFDLEDIELPLRYQEMVENHKKNWSYLKQQMVVIDKKEDVKGKKIFTKNQEEKIKAINEYYKREMQTLDMFLGEGGCKKLLNGRRPYLEMFEDFDQMLKPLYKSLDENVKSIEDRIKHKYKLEESNILK